MASNEDNDNSALAIDKPDCLDILLQEDRVLMRQSDGTSDASKVRSVTITIDDDYREITEAGIQYIEELLNLHENVQYINLERLTHATTSIPVSALVRILQVESIQGISDLRILGSNLQGTSTEWQQLAHVIRDNLQSMKFICIVEPLSWLPHIPLGALDPLVRVCASHPTLKFVATNLFSGVSLEAIDYFCQSPRIMGLHLVDIDASSDRVYRFLNQMKVNSKAWFLSIAFSETITADHGKAFADLLRRNKTIANLSIKSKRPLQEDFLLELVKGLDNNSSKLDEFSLEGSGETLAINNSCRTAMINMLERNKRLHRFHLEGIEAEGLSDEIDIFTNLNRAGRRRLLVGGPATRTASNQDWIDVLGHDAVKNDLNCIYYLLSKNPQVIYSQMKLQEEAPTRKRKRLHISS
jgi:hypothetical protein